MSPVHVLGIGMTRFARHPQRTLRSLTAEAVGAALKDAGIAAGEVGATLFANCAQGVIEGQHGVRGQVALQDTGVWGRPIVNVENASASGSTAFHLAWTWILSGQVDVALAVGAEKMFAGDNALSYRVFSGGWDIHAPEVMQRALAAFQDGDPDPASSGNPLLDLYTAMCRQHMRRFGLTQRQLAQVSSKNHAHGALNPLAQFREPIDVDAILAARSVGYPLTVPMCAPIGDGAAAAVLCSDAYLRRLASGARAVRVRACAVTSGVARPVDALDRQVTSRLARTAYEQAGIGPGELSVAEVHDASAFGEIFQTEALGLCAWGEGGALAASGATRLGGRLPVNPSGGLQCKGHPLAATGLGQIHEIVTQLRGEAAARQVAGARIGLVETSGGFNGSEEAAAAVLVLGN